MQTSRVRCLKMLNNNNKGMENGYVVLPIEKYSELVETVKKANELTERLIRLRVNYTGQVELDFDNEQFYKAAKKLYETSSLNTPERELIAPNSFSVWSSTLTHEVKTDETE